MISVLFIQKNSIYKKLNVDYYDLDRDGLTFNNKNVVIAHPPCRLFSRMRKCSTAPISEKFLAFFAINRIRENGGVLEHPAHSTLWNEMYLPLPGKGTDKYGGFSISIDQSWFNFKCKKNTWLYIVGLNINQLPSVPLSFDSIEYTICSSRRNNHNKKEINKSERSSTTLEFANFLIDICNVIQMNKNLILLNNQPEIDCAI